MKKKATWILVADGARARIAVSGGLGRPLRPAFTHEFAASRAPSRRRISDRPGRYEGGGVNGRHGFEPRTDAHDREKHLLARDLAAVLSRAAARRAFDRLILVAPPTMLGRLRSALTPLVRDRVAAEITKDLTHMPMDRLGRRLAEEMRL